MSIHVFFSFSTGLAKAVLAPSGTLASIHKHIEEVEKALGIQHMESGTGKDANIAWDHWDKRFRAGFPDIDNKLLCRTIADHNDWVRRFYDQLESWYKKPVKGGDKITPKDSELFWHGLHTLPVSPGRWTPEYYRNRMEHAFEVMRGREDEGVSFDTKALTPAQAGAVVHLFESWLDPDDARLECPKDRDYLADSGEYDWCSKCGAVDPGDADNCRKRKCPVLADRLKD
jgi:ribosomal protein L40E